MKRKNFTQGAAHQIGRNNKPFALDIRSRQLPHCEDKEGTSNYLKISDRCSGNNNPSRKFFYRIFFQNVFLIILILSAFSSCTFS